MGKYRAAYRNLILALLSMPCFSVMTLSSPMYGDHKHYLDGSAVSLEFTPRQIQMASGLAECVRTAWIGDVHRRTVICVEWRLVKKAGK